MTDRLVIWWTVLLEQLHSFLMQWKMYLISTIFPDCHCHYSAKHCWQLTRYCFVSYYLFSPGLYCICVPRCDSASVLCLKASFFYFFAFCHTMKRQPHHYSVFYIYNRRGETERALCSNIRIILNTLSFCTFKNGKSIWYIKVWQLVNFMLPLYNIKTILYCSRWCM